MPVVFHLHVKAPGIPQRALWGGSFHSENKLVLCSNYLSHKMICKIQFNMIFAFKSENKEELKQFNDEFHKKCVSMGM